MIQIDDKIAKEVRKKFPQLHIRKTANKYYLEENKAVLAYLKQWAERKE